MKQPDYLPIYKQFMAKCGILVDYSFDYVLKREEGQTDYSLSLIDEKRDDQDNKVPCLVPSWPSEPIRVHVNPSDKQMMDWARATVCKLMPPARVDNNLSMKKKNELRKPLRVKRKKKLRELKRFFSQLIQELY